MSAASIDVEASSGGAGSSSEGISGAAGSVSVAGSLGLTIANVQTRALHLRHGQRSGRRRDVAATSTTASSAKATAGATGSGVGAAVALNLVTDTTQAALGDGSVVQRAQPDADGDEHGHDDDDVA